MVTIELRGANHAARQSQAHLARVTVNLTFDDVPPMLVPGTEEANVFGSKLASSPVTKTAEQRVLANHDVWWESGSPGGAP